MRGLVLVAAGLVGLSGAPGRPDLVVSAVSVSQHDGAVVVTDVVRNRGAAVARTSSTAYFAGGVRLGGRAVRALRPGARSRGSVTLHLSPGTFRIRACADATRRVAETTEWNNCLASPRAITIVDATPPVFAGLESAVTCIPGPVGGATRSSSYALKWAAATDDVTPAAEIVYDVYQANSTGGETFTVPTYTTEAGATSFTTPQLPDDRAYYFVVRARDRAGNRDANAVERPGRNLCVYVSSVGASSGGAPPRSRTAWRYSSRLISPRA